MEKGSSLIYQDTYLSVQFRSGGDILYRVLGVNVALVDDHISKYSFDAEIDSVLLYINKFMLRAEISNFNQLTNNFKLCPIVI